MSPLRRILLLTGAAVFPLLAGSCGYRTRGAAMRLPSDVHTIYIQPFNNASQTYRVGQTFTEAVVKEMRMRTNFRVVLTNDGTADATLSGTIMNVSISPLTYASSTGASTSLVSVSLNAQLTGKHGNVLWSNPNFWYSEQYQESNDKASFFEEEVSAVQRMANRLAKTLVSDVLEGY